MSRRALAGAYMWDTFVESALGPPLCGFWSLNSDSQDRPQALLPPEPSHWPSNDFFKICDYSKNLKNNSETLIVSSISDTQLSSDLD